jgi:hypothetical protein
MSQLPNNGVRRSNRLNSAEPPLQPQPNDPARPSPSPFDNDNDNNTFTTDFNGQIGYFLGINFSCTKHGDGHVTINMGQEAFVENLCQIANLDGPHVNPVQSPYRSGCPVDTIPTDPNPPANLTHTMQVLLSCLTWLSISTRPDIATITNLLAQYTNKATPSHLSHVKRVIKYLKSTKTLGISFHSNNNSKLESHVKFPIPPGLTSLCDANWGPQDQSCPAPDEQCQVDIFKSRSLSGFLSILVVQFIGSANVKPSLLVVLLRRKSMLLTSVQNVYYTFIR